MKHTVQQITVGLVASAALGLAIQDGVTYDDTPLLPGSTSPVHGPRPWPEVVGPGASSSAAPEDATVLFDGSDLSKWVQGDHEPGWKVSGDAMEVSGGGSIKTRAEFGDCQLHVEFASPAGVKGSSQGRGNSGVFLMGRYEIQVLDSFENPTYPDGQCGALYGQCPPMVNASRGPGEWQSYDLVFRRPRFGEDGEVEPARVTLFHNGVLVHHDRALIGATTHRAVAKYSAHGDKGPIQLQDHGNPVRYRNIWIRELDLGGE